MKHGFIGFGHLAKAIYQGLKNEKITFAYTSKVNDFTEIRSFETIEELATFADVIWICVKPQDIVSVLEKLRAVNLSKKMVVSTVAGKVHSFYRRLSGRTNHHRPHHAESGRGLRKIGDCLRR